MLTFSFASANLLHAEIKSVDLLDPERQRDAPIPIHKSFWDMLLENWWILAATAAVLLFATFAWWLKKRLSRNGTDTSELAPRDPYKDALEGLQALENQYQKMKAKPFVFRLSEVLRVYVQGRFELPAMELTGEEFLREVAQHKFIRNHYDNLLRDFINRGDMVKYSRESIDGEGLRMLLDAAIHFVEDTHRRLEEERLREEQKQLKVNGG